MTIGKPKLGGRLRQLRLATGKSQAEVAEALGVSRSTIAQLELDKRRLHAEEIGRLASIYGCSPTSLLVTVENNPGEDDLLNDLAQTIPEFSQTPTILDGVRTAIALARELTTYENEVGLGSYTAGPPSHGFGVPNTQWEGAHQGYVAAQEERWRMNLGDAPVGDVDDTLALMRVRATRASLPADMLSVYIQTPETGTLVVVNESLSMEERRFQYLHAYAHALFDNEHRWLACRADCQNSLPELRATAFADRFLLPETGVRRYLQSLGKDTLRQATGTVQKLFSEGVGTTGSESPVRIDGRRSKGSRTISALDLAQIARYFGSSPSLTAHSLRNLRYMADDELDTLRNQEAEGTIARTRDALDLKTFRDAPKRDALRSRLLAQAVEAVRRGVIDIDRFKKTAALVDVTPEEQQLLLDAVDS